MPSAAPAAVVLPPGEEQQAGRQRERHRHVVAVGGDRAGGEDGHGVGAGGPERPPDALPQRGCGGSGERRRRGRQQDHLGGEPVGVGARVRVRRQREQRQRQRRVLEREVAVDPEALRDLLRVLEVDADVGDVEEVVPGAALPQQGDQDRPGDRLEGHGRRDQQRRLRGRPADGAEERRLRRGGRRPGRPGRPAGRLLTCGRGPALAAHRRASQSSTCGSTAAKSVSGRHSSPSCAQRSARCPRANTRSASRAGQRSLGPSPNTSTTSPGRRSLRRIAALQLAGPQRGQSPSASLNSRWYGGPPSGPAPTSSLAKSSTGGSPEARPERLDRLADAGAHDRRLAAAREHPQ